MRKCGIVLFISSGVSCSAVPGEGTGVSESSD